MRENILALLLGLLLDALLGDPAWLRHPVCFIGDYISFCEKRLRARGGNLRKSALLLTASTVAVTMLVTAGIVLAASMLGAWARLLVKVILCWLGLAAKSLDAEARGVGQALQDGVEAGRRQVARIVGRDTQCLSEEEIVKATVETVAENTTDGVISPMLFMALFGVVGLWGFKAASTLDSMVGYLDEKYRDIGWSSAKLDDVLNFIPARLTAFLLVAAAEICRLDARNALRIVLRDHANHKSPNCAWSEAAAAGALHIQLGGTHDYFGKPMEKPTIGDADRPAGRGDIEKTCRMMRAAALLAMGIFLLIGFCMR